MSTGTELRNQLDGTSKDLANKLDELTLVLFAGKFDPQAKVWPGTDVDMTIHAGDSEPFFVKGLRTDIQAAAVDTELKDAIAALTKDLPAGDPIKTALQGVRDAISKVVGEAAKLKDSLVGERLYALQALNGDRLKSDPTPANRFGEWKIGDVASSFRPFGFIPALAALAGGDTSGANEAIQKVIDASNAADAYTILVTYASELVAALGKAFGS